MLLLRILMNKIQIYWVFFLSINFICLHLKLHCWGQRLRMSLWNVSMQISCLLRAANMPISPAQPINNSCITFSGPQCPACVMNNSCYFPSDLICIICQLYWSHAHLMNNSDLISYCTGSIQLPHYTVQYHIGRMDCSCTALYIHVVKWRLNDIYFADNHMVPFQLDLFTEMNVMTWGIRFELALLHGVGEFQTSVFQHWIIYCNLFIWCVHYGKES